MLFNQRTLNVFVVVFTGSGRKRISYHVGADDNRGGGGDHHHDDDGGGDHHHDDGGEHVADEDDLPLPLGDKTGATKQGETLLASVGFLGSMWSSLCSNHFRFISVQIAKYI